MQIADATKPVLRRIRFRRLPCQGRIFLADGFADPAEVAAVLDAAGRAALPGSGIAQRHDVTGSSCELPYGFDPVLLALRARLRAACGFGNPDGWTFRFRRYAAGEYHPPHTDSYAIDGLGLVATAMLWLVAEAE